jgi:hypothetical protein
MIKSMRCGILYLILPLLLALRAGAAVVVAYRGEAPNTFGFLPLPSEANFDIDADGVPDYRFHTDGSFVAAVISYGTNRYISVLSTGDDQGGNLVPVFAGSIIGFDTSSLSGDWHRQTDYVIIPSLSTGYSLTSGPSPMQFADGYIGVEFAAADGIHYGWIQYVGFSHSEKGIGYPLLGGFIDSWAWETQPGVSIVAGAIPEPSAMTLVVVTAISLMQRRRKK